MHLLQKYALICTILLIFCLVVKVDSHDMSVVFSWKQISYDFDGVLYTKNSDYERTVGDNVHFGDVVEDADKFFIQYNNLPIGFELHRDILFVTVPRRRHGLTSISVDVGSSCEDTYAYITDLATNGLIVFSLRERDSWRIQDDSFKLDEAAMNFTVAGHVINWRDGLFSVALSQRDADGSRTAFLHPLVSTQEFSIDTAALKSSKHGNVNGQTKLLGTRGPLSQSGSHDHHSSGILFFANVAQDGVLCWNTRKPLTPQNVALVAQDHKKLVYISDLKVKSEEVWVLVNQIPRFIYDTLDPEQHNFFILKGRVQDLIRNTTCM